jgi:hypothetical protein
VNYIKVIDIATGRELPGLPTPRLIEKGSGEAFFVQSPPTASRIPDGVWYLRDEPDYVSPDGTYTRVRIAHLRDWTVRLEVRVIDPSYDDSDDDAPQNNPTIETFFVEAETRARAEDAATEEAVAWAGRVYGGDFTIDTAILSVKEGM